MHNAGVANETCLRREGRAARHAPGDHVEIRGGYRLVSRKLLRKVVPDGTTAAVTKLPNQELLPLPAFRPRARGQRATTSRTGPGREEYGSPLAGAVTFRSGPQASHPDSVSAASTCSVTTSLRRRGPRLPPPHAGQLRRGSLWVVCGAPSFHGASCGEGRAGEDDGVLVGRSDARVSVTPAPSALR